MLGALKSPTALMVFSTGVSCGSGTAMVRPGLTVPELAAATGPEQQQQRCRKHDPAAGQPGQQPPRSVRVGSRRVVGRLG